MKRLPVVAAILAFCAIATMTSLGFWQLRRAEWKDGLISQYAAAQGLPSMAFPATPDAKALPLYRKASGHCLEVTEWSAIGRRNVHGESGWSHLARCRTGAEGPGMVVDAGWSRAPANPDWRGGPVSGIIGSDPKALIRLVSVKPLASGLVASAPPSIADVPNNHRGYAFQWFSFAAIAAVIFALAAWRRMRG